MNPGTLPFAAGADRSHADAAWAAADALAEQLLHMLHVTGALVRQGRRVDLSGFDERVGRLCAAVLDLPHPQGCRVRPKLEELHTRLGAIGSEVASPPNRSGTETE